MKKIIFTFMCMLMFAFPVSAKEINHFYAEAGDINFKDIANSSVALAGDNLDVNGQINGVLFGAGIDVTISGKIDYAAIAGENVTISGQILKDAAIAGNVIEIENAIFERDAAMLATNLEISGTFRNLSATSEKTEIKNTTINGNLKLYSNNIVIGDNVTILGTFTYPENAKITMSDSAIVGKIVKEKETVEETTILDTITTEVISILSLILIFVIMSLTMSGLFTKLETKYDKISFEKGVETFTKGLVILVVVPILALLLLCISIGIPLAFILIALYVIAIYLSKIFIAYLIGSKISNKWFKEASILIKGLIGFTVIFVISFIPIINSLFMTLILFLGLGILLDIIRK